MKRKSWLIWSGIVLLVAAGAFLLFRWSQPIPGEKVTPDEGGAIPALEGVNASYRADVWVDPKEKKVEALLKARLKNDTGKDLDRIYFHIYANQFRKENPLIGQAWEEVLGKGAQPGWMKVEEVQVGGSKTAFDADGTLLSVPVHWQKGEEAEVRIRFAIGLPKNNGRLSYDEHAMWLGNWLPIKAVYDEEGWNLDPYYPIGDPFYSDVANYDVEVHVPKGYRVAATGVESAPEKKAESGYAIYRFTADKVRDFAMVVMDQEYRVMEGKTGNVHVLTWYTNKDDPDVVKDLHQVAIKSIETYSKSYGEYPYPEYDVVATGGFFGGMEYPGLIFAQGSYFERNNPYGIVVVAHETAHQWWYGVVGNDEVEHPWMDESLTEYSTLSYLIQNEKTLALIYKSAKDRAVKNAMQHEGRGEKISSGVDQFSNWDSYGLMIYEVGPMMFYEWEQKVGKEAMDSMLRDYYARFQFKNATPLDFLGVVKEHFGDDGVRFMEDWLEGKITLTD